MSAPLRASVLIPSYQSASTIRACLTSVLAQEFEGEFEVIVADSGNDATGAIVRREFPRVRVLKAETRMDPALARNWAAQDAKGDVLAFIDSDCVAERDWLRRLCTTVEAGAYAAAGGAIRNADGSTAAAWAGYFCEFREFLPRGAARDTNNLTLGNAAYRQEAFRRVGGFPNGFFPQEDQVFHQRIVAAGARIRFDPAIVVAHTHRRDLSAYLSHQVRIGAANARVVRALGLQGSTIASRRWLALLLLPALATYRFARTAAACWRLERCLLLRRPAVAASCWLGMFAWGLGFARPR